MLPQPKTLKLTPAAASAGASAIHRVNAVALSGGRLTAVSAGAVR